MQNIDAALSRLREHPADPRLEQMDDAVLSALDHQRPHGAPLSGAVFGLAAGVALTIGLAGTAVPGSQARTAPLAPFGAPPALAPSTLLGMSR